MSSCSGLKNPALSFRKAAISTNSGVITKALSELFLERSRSQIGQYLAFRLGQKRTEYLFSRLREEDLQVGVTPKEEIYREDNVVLYRYTPMVERPFPIPVLIVYALVNRPYMVDLQEDRSLVRNLLKLGIDVYLIDWGYPSRGDCWLTLDDYINGYLNNCVDNVRARHGLDRINPCCSDQLNNR